MKRFFAILCILLTFFLVGCKAETQLSGKVEDGKPKETTNSTADDSKYYDSDGKIILKPINDEKKEKMEEPEIKNEKEVEKADFSDRGTLENIAQVQGTLWDGSRDGIGIDNWRGALPETMAGFITVATWHKSQFGIPIRVTSVVRSSSSNHSSGAAVDMYSDELIPAPERGVGRHGSNNCRLPAQYLDDPDYADVHANRQMFKKAVSALNIKVLDEYEEPVAWTGGPHLHLQFTNYNGGGIIFNIFDGLKNIGDILSVIINKFTDVAAKAYSALYPYAAPLIWLLAIIDICLTIILSGMEVSLFQVIVPKILKYTGIYGVLILWPDFVNAALSTATMVSETIDPSHAEDVAQNISQPQLVMQKGFHLLQPGIDFMSSITFDQFLVNLFPCLLLILGGLIGMAALIMIAIYVTTVYIEFFVGAGLAIFLLPFSSLKFTKFLAEGAASWLLNNAIRLTTLSLMIGMIFSTAFKSATNQDLVNKFSSITKAYKTKTWFERVIDFSGLGKAAEAAKATVSRMLGNQNAFSDTMTAQVMAATCDYLAMVIVVVFLCYLVYRVTESIYRHVVATIEIPD